MTATPEKVRALTQLLADAAPALVSDGWDLEDLAQRMLLSGRVDVDVDLPEPAPTPQPRDVAIATVLVSHLSTAWDAEAVAWRCSCGDIVFDALGPVIAGRTVQVAVPAGVSPLSYSHALHQAVTVTSRAVVVTEADRDELRRRMLAWRKMERGARAADIVTEWWAELAGGTR